MGLKLSICIPTLNRGAYIGQTLASIVAQASDDMEIVIVDGGSTDNTEDVVRRYQAQLQSIRYIRRDTTASKSSNEGFDRDCNYAVEQASGDYCWIMTDDDLLVPGAVQAIMAEVDKRQFGLIVASVSVRDKELTEVLVAKRPEFPIDKIYFRNDWEKFAIDAGNHLTFAGAVIISRNLWLSRDKEKYIGSGYIHVGTIFERPLEDPVLLKAAPLVIIRFGNAQWSSRAFKIAMFDWPRLVWSFGTLSTATKLAIVHEEPWRRLRTLLVQRIYGAYSMEVYRALLRPLLQRRVSRFAAIAIAKSPRKFLLSAAICYVRLTKKDDNFLLTTLLYSKT
jgi:abequosyltransferase